MISKNTIKLIKSLKDKVYRQQENMYIVEGDKLISEIIHYYPDDIVELFLTDTWLKTNKLPDIKNRISPVSLKEIERLSNFKTPTNALALLKIKKYSIEHRQISQNLSLVLDNIQDPGNLGNIIRIADWFGIENIFCSTDSADCYNSKVIQSSMGSIFRVGVHYLNLIEFIQKQSVNKEFYIYGTFIDGISIYEEKLDNKGLIIMGNESKGIDKKYNQYINKKLSIPSFKAGNKIIDSLNISSATAVICSEFRRRDLI